MAIRVTDIPGLQGTQINAPKMNPNAAAAPAAALGEVAQSIVGIGGGFEKLGLQLQDSINAENETRITRQWRESAANFQIELQKDLDPVSRKRKTDEFLSGIQKAADDPQLAPVVRQRLIQRFEPFATDITISVAENSAKILTRRASEESLLKWESAMENNNRAEARESIEIGRSYGLISPEQEKRLWKDFDDKQRDDAVTRGIYADPARFLEDNPTPDPKDPVKWENRANLARKLLRTGAADAADKFDDLAASGKITTPEQIDQLFGDQRPAVVEQFKIDLAKRGDAAEQARLRDPRVQNQIIGEASALIDSYDPAGSGPDADYVKIDGLIRGLPESAARAELKKQLDSIRSGAEEEVKTHAQEAMKALADAYKNNRFGRVDGTGMASMSLQQAISDGVLTDTAKLGAIFPADVAEEIATGKKDSLGESKKRELTDSERAELFRSKLGELPPEQQAAALASLDPMSRAAFEAIRDRAGFSSFIEVPNSEAGDAAIADRLTAQEAYGRAKSQLADWLKINTKATPKEIDDKIFEIAGEEARKKLSEGFFDAKPAKPKAGEFVPGETSMNLPEGLAPLRSVFVEQGLMNGVDPRFLAAVSMHETARGTSKAFRSKNNAMGVSNAKGPIAFDNSAESIARMARLLGSTTSGPYKNARTIQQIASIYAPPGAGNDPGNLNPHWAAGVAKYYAELGGNPSAPIKGS